MTDRTKILHLGDMQDEITRLQARVKTLEGARDRAEQIIIALASIEPAPVTLAEAAKVPEVQALVVTLQYTLKLCEDGHPVSAKNLAHACLRAIGEGEA